MKGTVEVSEMLSDDDRRLLTRAIKHFERGNLLKREVVGLLRDVANEANLTEVLPLLPEDLAALVSESLARQPSLRAVGYWMERATVPTTSTGCLPDPRNLVSPQWCLEAREKVLAYLRAGETYNRWRGFSHCRFACGTPDVEMGTRCLTDGEWVWPEGLPHYVESHAVRLPDEFVASMRENAWQVPPDISANRFDHGDPHMGFWIEWASGM
jgi:hypothetical protein